MKEMVCIRCTRKENYEPIECLHCIYVNIDWKGRQTMKKYHTEILYGWSKSYYRNFNTIAECENWLDKMSQGYLPSQIVNTLIRLNN